MKIFNKEKKTLITESQSDAQDMARKNSRRICNTAKSLWTKIIGVSVLHYSICLLSVNKCVNDNGQVLTIPISTDCSFCVTKMKIVIIYGYIYCSLTYHNWAMNKYRSDLSWDRYIKCLLDAFLLLYDTPK